MDTLSDLDRRTGLPDALCVLLREYPRDLWQSHAQFDGLIRFWLDRHALFRTLLGRLDAETGGLSLRAGPPEQGLRNTAGLARMLIEELHGHHRIEDLHYFPRLARLEPRLERGFDILDRDHHALDTHLARLVETTNGLIRAEPDAVAQRAEELHDRLDGFGVFLDRHLVDEEDLVVPILLRHGASLEG